MLLALQLEFAVVGYDSLEVELAGKTVVEGLVVLAIAVKGRRTAVGTGDGLQPSLDGLGSTG